MIFQSTIAKLLHHFYGLKKQIRHFSAVKVENLKLANYDTFHPNLRATIQQLDAIAPRFELAHGEVEILDHPQTFYETLKSKISDAQDRIFLSSLYIGKAQDELIQCIYDSLASKPRLKVYILIDCLRSTRDAPHKSTASLLTPLVEKFGKERVDIRFYHTPNLKGFTKSFLPKRINEGWGLQHMKIYGFDKEVLLSGANLSEDYFTNRQDRYYIFKSQALSDYYYNVQEAISSLSYQLLPANNKQQFELDWPNSNSSSEPHSNFESFLRDSTRLLSPILKQHGVSSHKPLADPCTIVYPVSSFAPLMKPDESTEKQAILRLLTFLHDPTVTWTFTAGYFNMHPDYKHRLGNSLASGTVITASPQANSFYKSKGISYYLPDAYLYNAKQFLQHVYSNKKEHTVKLLEWKNGIVNTKTGWSYHAKGLWVSLPGELHPSATVIGSSNYTKRAYALDLETNAVIITKDEELKKSMQDEVENLCEFTKELKLEDFEKADRHISRGVRVAARILGGML